MFRVGAEEQRRLLRPPDTTGKPIGWRPAFSSRVTSKAKLSASR